MSLSSSHVGMKTDPGRRRERNEDTIQGPPHDMPQGTIVQKGLLFVVADGVGGAGAGQEASRLAVQTLYSHYYQDGDTDIGRSLRNGIVNANQAVFRLSQTLSRSNPDTRGMGTTLTAAVLRGGYLHLGHVGDSRAYLLRGGQLRQLTKDHTEVQELVDRGSITPAEARVHDRRSRITRAVGGEMSVMVDVPTPIPLQAGDRLLLCSDGLSGEVKDPEIAQLIEPRRKPTQAVRDLIALANDRGGPDNISAIVVDVPAEIAQQAAAAPAQDFASGTPTYQAETIGLDAGTTRRVSRQRFVEHGSEAPLGQHSVPPRRHSPAVPMLIAAVAVLGLGSGVFYMLTQANPGIVAVTPKANATSSAESVVTTPRQEGSSVAMASPTNSSPPSGLPAVVTDTPPAELPTPNSPRIPTTATQPTTRVPTQRPWLSLRASSPEGPTQGCRLHFEWVPLDESHEYDVQVCFGSGCPPTLGVFKGNRWFFWDPAIPLEKRADLTGRSGTYTWRVHDMTAQQFSQPVKFTWTNDGCGVKQQDDRGGCGTCQNGTECISGRCQCPAGTLPNGSGGCE